MTTAAPNPISLLRCKSGYLFPILQATGLMDFGLNNELHRASFRYNSANVYAIFSGWADYDAGYDMYHGEPYHYYISWYSIINKNRRDQLESLPACA